MIRNDTHKDSFISGWLEAQPEWQAAKSTCRELYQEHMRLEHEELTPEHIEKVSEYLGPLDADDPDLWEVISISLETAGFHDLHEGIDGRPSLAERAEAAWREYIGS